ncbi:MAG: UDP-N-acetylmuramoyl-L-alanine--D-glutamate ligase [Blastocatellia bacterium]
MILEQLEQRRVVLLGFGVEGQATYEYLRSRFPNKPIGIADLRPLADLEIAPGVLSRLKDDGNISVHCGEKYLNALRDYEVIVKTPGIAKTNASLRAAVERGAMLTSQMEVFFELFDRRRIIGVTGTKGKSTTTSLIYKLAREAGLDMILGGNIGEPPLLRLDQATEKAVFVLELSSYQLEPLRRSPHVAVLLNIVPEHLDYHPSFAEYASAKQNITSFQDESDFLVYNSDYRLPSEIASRTLARGVPFSVKRALEFGCYLEDGRVIFADGQTQIEILKTRDIPLIGAFNVQNVCAAVTAAVMAGASTETMADSVRTFKPLPHRLEFIGEYRGIRFYNDSISTVPESALSAVEALGADVQTLILGGHERHLDYADFASGLLSSKVENLILFSPTGTRMWEAVQAAAAEVQPALKALPVETMEEAVRVAFENTSRGRICLLSPASPSYGKFKDYRERGDVFRKLVAERSADRWE